MIIKKALPFLAVIVALTVLNSTPGYSETTVKEYKEEIQCETDPDMKCESSSSSREYEIDENGVRRMLNETEENNLLDDSEIENDDLNRTSETEENTIPTPPDVPDEIPDDPDLEDPFELCDMDTVQYFEEELEPGEFRIPSITIEIDSDCPFGFAFIYRDYLYRSIELFTQEIETITNNVTRYHDVYRENVSNRYVPSGLSGTTLYNFGIPEFVNGANNTAQMGASDTIEPSVLSATATNPLNGDDSSFLNFNDIAILLTTIGSAILMGIRRLMFFS